jgi:DNA polymerase III epsilon subunit-like protein
MKQFLTYDLETAFLQKGQKRPATRMLEIALKKVDDQYQRLINPCQQYQSGQEVIKSLDEMNQHPDSTLRFWTKLLIGKGALSSAFKRKSVFEQAEAISTLLKRSDLVPKVSKYNVKQWLYALENSHDKVSVAQRFLDKYNVKETPKSLAFVTTADALAGALEFGLKHTWIAHNGKSFDMPIVKGNCERSKLNCDTIDFKDSLPMFRKKMDMDSYSQPNLYRSIFSTGYRAHHALDDAIALFKLLQYTAEKESTTVLKLFEVKKLPIKVKHKSDLLKIKGVGQKTVGKFKLKGIHNQKDLDNWVDLHDKSYFLEEFKGLYRYKKLAEYLYNSAVV